MVAIEPSDGTYVGGGNRTPHSNISCGAGGPQSPRDPPGG